MYKTYTHVIDGFVAGTYMYKSYTWTMEFLLHHQKMCIFRALGVETSIYLSTFTSTWVSTLCLHLNFTKVHFQYWHYCYKLKGRNATKPSTTYYTPITLMSPTHNGTDTKLGTIAYHVWGKPKWVCLLQKLQHVDSLNIHTNFAMLFNVHDLPSTPKQIKFT